MPTYTYDHPGIDYDESIPWDGNFTSVGLAVTINGASVELLQASFVVDHIVGERSVCSFIVKDDSGTEHFQRFEPVSVADKYGTVHFSGFIDLATEVKPSPNSSALRHTIVCMDNHYLADKRVAVATYTSTTAGDIVTDLIADYLAAEGVTAGTIEDGPMITSAIFDYVPVSEALMQLAEKANFWWQIDADKKLHFRDRSSFTAPWNLSASDALLDTVTLTHASPQYRNRQYIKGARNKTDTQTATRVGDDNTKSFALGYPLAETPTVEVDSVVKTVGIKGVDTGKDWYWSKDDAIITQDEAATALTSSETLEVTYKGFYPIVVRLDDVGEQAILAALEGEGTGFVENVDTIPQDETQTEALESAAAKLTKFAERGRTLTFRTRRAGLEPGHLLTVTLAPHDLTAVEFLVQSVNVVEETPYLTYTVIAITGPDATTWTQFFARLTSQPHADINVGTATTLLILESTSESWTWGESVSETVYACPVCNTTTLCDTDVLVC